MSLILDRCYFCLFREAKHVVEDGEDTYHLCSECNDQFEEALANVGKSPLELPRQNASDVCCSCGLCCVVLCAPVEEGEAKKLLKQANATGRHPHDVTIGQFCTPQEKPPYRGGLVMNFPCVYLKGSVLNYVACRAYDLDRPSVCRSYLCKIAVQYKLGLISLGEARFRLRSSFMVGDVEVFNWSPSGARSEEDRISLMIQVAGFVDRLKAAGVEEKDWPWAVAQYLTPSYILSSELGRSLFNMHLNNVDHENFDLELYIPEIVKELSERDRAVALQVLEAVLRDIRKLFIRADEVKQQPEEIKSEDDGPKIVVYPKTVCPECSEEFCPNVPEGETKLNCPGCGWLIEVDQISPLPPLRDGGEG